MKNTLGNTNKDENAREQTRKYKKKYCCGLPYFKVNFVLQELWKSIATQPRPLH